MNFASDVTPTAAIYDYVKRVVVPMLSTIEGVGEVQAVGSSPMAMRIWLDPGRMTARGVTADDVTNAIRANNFQSAPGQAKGVFVVSNITAETGFPASKNSRKWWSRHRTAHWYGSRISPK